MDHIIPGRLPGAIVKIPPQQAKDEKGHPWLLGFLCIFVKKDKIYIV